MNDQDDPDEVDDDEEEEDEEDEDEEYPEELLETIEDLLDSECPDVIEFIESNDGKTLIEIFSDMHSGFAERCDDECMVDLQIALLESKVEKC